MRRVRTTKCIANLFSNVPIELGVTDTDFVQRSTVRIGPKTFSRCRIHPPKTVSSDYVLALARWAATLGSVDAAQVLHMVREGPDAATDAFHVAMSAATIATDAKDRAHHEQAAAMLAGSSRRVLLFDRANSFTRLEPVKEDPEPVTPKGEGCEELVAPPVPLLRFIRRPRLFTILTYSSLSATQTRFGDEGLYHLIDAVESGELSMTVVNDAPAMAHRVFRGIFADAAAVVIFDRARMAVQPLHRRTIRWYDAHTASHRRIIADAVGMYGRMRRFRIHPPGQAGVTRLLEQFLSQAP